MLWLLAAVFACPAGAVASACCSPGAFGAYVEESQFNLITTSTGPFWAPLAEQFVELKPWLGAAAALNASSNKEAVLLGTVSSAVLLDTASPVSWLHAWEKLTGIVCSKCSKFRDFVDTSLDDPVCCWVWNLGCFLFGCWIRPFSDSQRIGSKQKRKRKHAVFILHPPLFWAAGFEMFLRLGVVGSAIKGLAPPNLNIGFGFDVKFAI